VKVYHVALRGSRKETGSRLSTLTCTLFLLPHAGICLTIISRTDIVLFRFLEQYLRRLEGPLALQVWGRFIQLAKDVIGNARDLKMQTFPTLRSELHQLVTHSEVKTSFRCLSVLAEKITQTTATEDRRIRKELQVSKNDSFAFTSY
jgi:hypothetical protein